MDKLDRRLTLEQLRCFVAVVDSGGFVKACEQLHRSQATVTQQIKKLEAIIGSRLLQRSQGHLGELTDAGARFLSRARIALAATESAYRAARGDPLHGHVRLGMLDDFNAQNIPSVIALFGRIHPNVTIEIVSDLSFRLEEGIQNKKLDIAVLKRTYRERRKGEETPLLVEELQWVMKDKLLVDMEAPLPLVVFHEGCIFRQHMINALSKTHREWRIAYSSYNYANILAALHAGLGLSALPTRAVRSGLQILANREEFSVLPKVELAIALSKEVEYAETAKALEFHLAQAFSAGHGNLLDTGT